MLLASYVFYYNHWLTNLSFNLGLGEASRITFNCFSP